MIPSARATGLALACIASLALRAAAYGGELFAGRPCMGTVLEVTLDHPSPEKGRALLDRAFTEAHRLEQILSNWSPDTELSRFNARAGQGPVPLSAELAQVFELCIRMHTLTEGAFDVTLGPVILYLRHNPYDFERVRAAHALVNGRALTIRGRQGALARRGMAVDLGGVGKGYAIDRMRELLVAGGARSGFIDFGQSSQLAFGPVPRRVAARDLTGRPGPALELKDMALSTSDSGRAESSILDPRTGALVREHRQATVLAPTAAEAEAWTKPLIVLGRAWLCSPSAARLPGRVVYQDARGILAR